MNKYGLISCVLTFVLVFFSYIPLGIYFRNDSNPWLGLNSLIQIPINLFYYKDKKYYIWGIISPDKARFWLELHLLTFGMLYCLSFLSGILALIGFTQETKTGKKLMSYNFYSLLVVVIYVIIGIPFYSKAILGIQIEYIEIFWLVSFGFYILVIDMIIAFMAKIKHPVK